MADQPATGPNGNAFGAVQRLGQSLIGALPPAFLLLVLINAGFLAVVLWFVDDQMDSRTAMATKIIERCLDVASHKP